ncbi:MAG: putative hydroxymethylpyrimidine transporter CytX, partial [Lachnospiraceae bacterium]|nr:putative hydroxymethylpyrimidine transporter CytX [Lachnospiraceae bacterium]
ILKKNHEGKAADICNLAVWVIGFVIYRLLMTVDIIVGCTLPDMAITMIICIAADKLIRKRRI